MISSHGFLLPLLGLLTLFLAFTLAIPDRPYIGPRCVTSRECGHNGLCASDSHCTCPLGYSPHRNWTTCNPVFCMSDYDCEIRWPNTVCHRNTSNRCGCLLFYHLDSAQLTCQLSEAVYISAAACAIGLFLCTALGVLFYTLARRHAQKGKKIKKKVIRHY